MDSIKDVVRSFVKVPKFDKHLKKAVGHIGRNVVEITIKMKTIVRKPLMRKKFLREFVTTDSSDCQLDSAALIRVLSNIEFFMNSPIEGSSNIPTLGFSILIHRNFNWRKANPLPSRSIALTKFFNTLNLICESESILFDSTRGWTWTLCEPGFNPCLNGQSCLI